MKIPAINNIYQPQFKGKFKESQFTQKALTNFNNAELEEFNMLKNRMSKINDGKTFKLLEGTICSYKNNTDSELEGFIKYAQLYSESTNGKCDFYNKEVYAIEIKEFFGKENFKDPKAFVRAILEPLKRIYK